MLFQAVIKYLSSSNFFKILPKRLKVHSVLCFSGCPRFYDQQWKPHNSEVELREKFVSGKKCGSLTCKISNKFEFIYQADLIFLSKRNKLSRFVPLLGALKNHLKFHLNGFLTFKDTWKALEIYSFLITIFKYSLNFRRTLNH